MKINYKKLTSTATAPTRNHREDAGFDLYADESVTITTSSLAGISTGIALDIPKGYYGQVQERSGFSLKNTLKLKAGVVDAGYQGDIKLIFVNTGEAPVKVYQGDKIAQIVIHKLPLITLNEVEDFAKESERGEKGFGSSDEPITPDVPVVKNGSTVTVSTTQKSKK